MEIENSVENLFAMFIPLGEMMLLIEYQLVIDIMLIRMRMKLHNYDITYENYNNVSQLTRHSNPQQPLTKITQLGTALSVSYFHKP